MTTADILMDLEFSYRTNSDVTDQKIVIYGQRCTLSYDDNLTIVDADDNPLTGWNYFQIMEWLEIKFDI